MFLTIDSGNSRTKCVVYDTQGKMMTSETFAEDHINDLFVWIKDKKVKHAIVSVTGKNILNFSDFDLAGKVIELSHETRLPIKIVYKTPETLGRDRIAAACGAHALYPERNCLVVDAGTCMTVDLVLASGIYLGGNISPGLSMRLRAMHEETARLPLVEPGWPELEFGDSTLHALQNGACLGMVMEIEGLLNRAKEAYGEVSIVITGGDAGFLANQKESWIFAEPELVTLGLFQILYFNVQNNY